MIKQGKNSTHHFPRRLVCFNKQREQPRKRRYEDGLPHKLGTQVNEKRRANTVLVKYNSDASVAFHKKKGQKLHKEKITDSIQEKSTRLGRGKGGGPLSEIMGGESLPEHRPEKWVGTKLLYDVKG